MPAHTSPFDPFRRFRLRSTTVPVLPSSSEEDSDGSSPERDRRPLLHVLPPKTGRRSAERTPDKHPRAMPDSTTHIALTFSDPPHPSRPERTPKKPSPPGLPSDPVDVPTKATLIRRMSSKLHITIPSRPPMQSLRSRPSTRTLPAPTQGLRSPKATVPPSLPNGFVSREHREAALRERGLRPPRKDLSEQEREADERIGSLPSPSSLSLDGPSEAERFKASWLTMHRSSESIDSDGGPGLSAPPHLQGASTAPWSVPASRSASAPPDPDPMRSAEGRKDLSPVSRPSICSSVPPLSVSSYLEVLPEDPLEQAPVTPPLPVPPPKLPIIVTSSLDLPSSPVFVESPLSCSFSSHCHGSTVDSHSQSDHSRVLERRNTRSTSASRGRKSESGDRPRKFGTSSLSRMGTNSLSNLRRSVAGSLKLPSSSTLSSVDPMVPRAAISPTMHSIGSIIRETRDIADAESRRLSELAFLD